jgi:hypothetical protein
MAPEQLYGAQTPATDLYALGATVLHAATGKAPDEQPRDGLAIDVDAAAPFLSPSLRALLLRLLSPDPKGRPLDAAALLRELQGMGNVRSATTNAKAKAKDDDVVVEAVWREDEAERALSTGRGALGLIAALVALLGTIGIGRVVLPVVLTVIGLFVSDAERRRLAAVRDVVVRGARDAQEKLERVAVDRAAELERDVERNRTHADEARRKTSKKAAKTAARLHRRDGFWRL